MGAFIYNLSRTTKIERLELIKFWDLSLDGAVE